MNPAPNLIRQAAVAGQFYPGDAAELAATVQNFLDHADVSTGPVPKAIIAPHAGYVYSGAIAATAYARLLPARATIRRVVLLGPCHRVSVQGLALSGAEFFRTPLGDIPVDADAARKILDFPQVSVFDDTHLLEHSLEVHLPFLQSVLDDFTLVALVVGETAPNEIADVLDALWGGPETLIVVSSDLSHYLDYDSARTIDAETSRAIEALDPGSISPDGACGRVPVGGLLEAAKRRGLTVTTLDLRNSGDTAGSKDRVVGYGSWAFFSKSDAVADAPPETANETANETKALLDQYGESLLGLAAIAIKHGLENGKPPHTDTEGSPEELTKAGACFVTLKRDGKLRGCIGTSEAHQALILDVAENAFRAAFKDPRFPALTNDELDGLELSISVLSPKTPMIFSGEADFMGQLQPNIDGLIIEDKNCRALFLPSVWKQLPDTNTFVEHLKVKAGLPKDHWSDSFKAWRFTAEEISSADMDDPQSFWRN